MALIRTFRHFLTRLEKRGDLVRVGKKVSPLYEAAAIVKRAMETSGRTVVLENVGYNNFKMVGNVYGGRAKFATLFDVTESEVRHHFEKLSRRSPVQPRMVTRAPVHEVVHQERISVTDILPVPWQYEHDRSRYINGGLLVTRDPETGIHNISFQRLMVNEGNILSIQIVPRMDLDSIYRRAQARKQPLEVAVVIGASPWIFLAASTHIPLQADEYDFAGALQGESVRAVRCKTVGLIVPAQAEIVIEGRIPPTILCPEGPMGEVHGYYGTEFPKPIIEVSAVTHRRDPLFHTIMSGTAEEHAPLALPIEVRIIQAMRQIHRDVVDINMMPSLYRCVASVRNLPDYDTAERLLRTMLGHPWVFLAILVNDDIDITNPEEVFWAITTRTNPQADVLIDQFPTDTRVDDRGIPPTPVKRPFEGLRYRTGINASVDGGAIASFKRSRTKAYNVRKIDRLLS